ncbi:hypothetical protein TNIN_480451 [Trichonephila inaurata madagascariensis]|uniref:Uncharacterized protein n=1 Tax=Trichonephila inaurata madagascariensis TaxID=2747483 RepID=A0A8X6Y7W3_9ARAC|nr:hypothetical protein TNIN_480451 [Trichonephila inaurata madagascariensis]
MRPSPRAACLSDIRCLSNGTLAKLSGEHYFSKSRVPRQPPPGTPDSDRKWKNFGKEPEIGKKFCHRTPKNVLDSYACLLPPTLKKYF